MCICCHSADCCGCLQNLAWSFHLKLVAAPCPGEAVTINGGGVRHHGPGANSASCCHHYHKYQWLGVTVHVSCAGGPLKAASGGGGVRHHVPRADAAGPGACRASATSRLCGASPCKRGFGNMRTCSWHEPPASCVQMCCWLAQWCCTGASGLVCGLQSTTCGKLPRQYFSPLQNQQVMWRCCSLQMQRP